MKKLRLSELSDAVRAFFSQLSPDESVVIQDDRGQLQYGVTPYARATNEERQQAWQEIVAQQQRAGQAMKEAGVTEDDVVQALLEDD